jgi:ferredoxin
MPDNAYKGLLSAIQNSPPPRKTLVITCDEGKVPKTSWVDVENVPGIAVIGVRQLAMAASTSINATVIYCPDGLCAGKEHVKRAANLISSITKASPPSVYYLEGAEAGAEIERIHNSTHKRDGAVEFTAKPWESYVTALENIAAEGSQATGLGITDMQIAESCTLCNACVDKCPHTALRIEGGELIFNSRECTGCGYCGQICPERAVTLLERDGSIEFAEKAVYLDEMVRCSKCNTPYASAKMIRKVSAVIQINETLSICPTCRERGMYEGLFGKASSKVVN